MQDNTHDSVDKVYEIGYVFLSSIPEEKIVGEVTALKAALAKVKAEIIAEGAPELHQLAYIMTKKIQGANKRFSEGYFGWVKFELQPSAVEALKKSLDGTENILRYLFITTVKENTYLGKKSLMATSIGGKDVGLISPVGIVGDATAIAADGMSAVAAVSPAEAIDKSIDEMVK